MMKYGYRVYLEMGEVRSMCIENDFYTAGDNESYNKMLEKCTRYNLSPADMVEIAQDIVDHTPEDNPRIASYEALDEVVCILTSMAHVDITTKFSGYVSSKAIRKADPRYTGIRK